MSWPVTARFLDFIANTTRITAAALNAFQDATIGIYGGTKSIMSLWIDGVGNAASAVANGALRVANGVTIDTVGLTVTSGPITASSGTISSTAGKLSSGLLRSTGVAVAQGDIYKNTTILAIGRVDNTGAMSSVGATGISDVSGGANTKYDITIGAAPANHYVVAATGIGDNLRVDLHAESAGTSKITLWTYSAGTLAAINFEFIVLGY